MVDFKNFLNKPNERVYKVLELYPESSKIKHTVALTNKRIILFKKVGKVNSYKDIPLPHITSAEFDFSGIQIGKIIWGIVLIILGLINIFLPSTFYYCDYYYGTCEFDPFGYIFVILSILFLIWGVLLIIKAFTIHGELRIYSYEDRPKISSNIKVRGYNNEITKFIRLLYFAQEIRVIVDNINELGIKPSSSTITTQVQQPSSSQTQIIKEVQHVKELIEKPSITTKSEKSSTIDSINFQRDELFEEKLDSKEKELIDEVDEDWLDKKVKGIKESTQKGQLGVKSSEDLFNFSSTEGKDDDLFIDQIKCPTCGALMPKSNKFCNSCGSLLKN